MILRALKSFTLYHFFGSAGVGRTGTLIGLDILLQCMKAKKKIDIFGVVLKLREQRPFMVQTQVMTEKVHQLVKKRYMLHEESPDVLYIFFPGAILLSVQMPQGCFG